jgi:epoxyqueuosine reductase
MKELRDRNQLIKKEASRLGFLDCGITSAEPPENEGAHLNEWIGKGYHGGMRYMEDQLDVRTDPKKLLKGARSVIIVLQNYWVSRQQKDPAAPIVARYAFGRDYHTVMKKKLKKLLGYIQAEILPCRGRIFVDSAPVLEKALACRAGLGWIGKNSLLVSSKSGSFFFIGGIITDLELDHSAMVPKDICGDCNLCIEACPTGAIVLPRVLDVRKCISFLTIENRDCGLPAELKEKFLNRVFGCDICQNVCPWNRNARSHNEPALKPNPALLEMTRDEWYTMDDKKFISLFKDTELERLQYSGLKRNLNFLLKS